MKKLLAVGIIFLLVSMSISSTGRIVEKMSIVSSNGNILYVGGSGEGNYTRIQDAVDNASDGDTVFVYNGTYYEVLHINKSINLMGERKENTVIKYPKTRDKGSENVIYIIADSCSVKGLSIIGDDAYSDVMGINVNSSFNIISNNIVFDSCIGINVGDFTKKNNVSLNRLSNNLYGVSLHQSNYNNVSKNTISSSLLYGIYMFLAEGNNVFRNHLSDNWYGIKVKNSQQNVIFNNRIFKNLEGIELCCSSGYNIIYSNIFENNSENANDSFFNQWDNNSVGNYWDDYNGTDDNKDGIGDSPYPIPGGDNEDRYPLMEPFGMTELTMIIKKGLIKFSGIIKNIGNNTAFNVQWKVGIEGGIFVFRRTSSGPVPIPLLSGEEVWFASRVILGFGAINLTIVLWADNAPKFTRTISGFLFLFFLI